MHLLTQFQNRGEHGNLASTSIKNKQTKFTNGKVERLIYAQAHQTDMQCHEQMKIVDDILQQDIQMHCLSKYNKNNSNKQVQNFQILY